MLFYFLGVNIFSTAMHSEFYEHEMRLACEAMTPAVWPRLLQSWTAGGHWAPEACKD